MVSKKIKPAYYPLTLLGLGVAGLGLFYLVNPSLFSSMLSAFRIFKPTGAQLTTIEMQPLISSSYGNPFRLVWGNFPGLIPPDPNALGLNFINIISFISTSFFISLISLGILIYLVVKQGSTDKTLLIVWSLVILAAILGQRRFGYYFAVNVALLTGYLSWRVLELLGFKELTTKAVKAANGAAVRRVRPQKGGFPITVNHFVMTLAVLVILLVVFAPNILFPIPGTDKSPTISTASQARFAPSDAWVSSLIWLKENTPEPFANPDAYYQLRELPPPGEDYQYPESAYGVLAWWDYGYWITRIAHRLPNANPSQSSRALTSVASFFTSQDEKLANEIAQELDSAYIIVDHETVRGKFWAVATWAGREPAEYFDTYLARQENQLLAPVILYYPEYYRSLAVRLYNFNGKAVTPESTLVISYQENADKAGNLYKIISGVEQFDTYQEAETYLLSQESSNFEIVGTNPMVSPVPLAALEHYQLIHSSDSAVILPDVGAVPAVKIFEYIE